MTGTSIRRFGVRTAVTGLILAGATAGTAGLAVAAEPNHGNEAVAVDVQKNVDVNLGKVGSVHVDGDDAAEIGKGLTLDADKQVKVELGDVIRAKLRLTLGL